MRLNLYQWCVSTATYSAPTKAWDGQATFVNPGTDFFTPQTAGTAQGMNYILKQHSANDAALLDLAGCLDANNWLIRALAPTGGALDGTHNGEIGKVAWDTKYGRWIFWIKNLNNSGHAELWTSMDGGHSTSRLSDVGSSPNTVRLNMAVRATDGVIAMVQSGDAADCYTFDPVAVATTTHAAAGPKGNRKVVEWFAGASLFVSLAADATSNTNAFNVGTSPDGATWTDRTVSAAMTATSNMVPANDYATCTQSPTTFAVFPTVTGATTFYVTSDGITWASHTTPIGGSETIEAVDYDSVNGLWLVLAVNGTTSKLYTSPDFTAWTARTISTSTTYSGIAASNGLYVAVAKGTPGTAGISRAVYSTDQGITWRWCTGFSLPWMFSTYSLAGDLGERIRSNGQQFVAYNFDGANLSLITGQSPVAN